MAKNYRNRYLANKIVKKLINKFSGKIKDVLISPLMDMLKFNGENIDKYILYDVINDSDLYKNVKQTEITLDQIDNLMDFIRPIIEIIKIIGSKSSEKVTKINQFLEYMSTFDYQRLIQISKNIYESISNTEIDIKFDNSLSSLIRASNPSLSDEEIDNTSKELIECGIINKEGEFNKKFIITVDLKIDEKYMEYQYIEGKYCSEELDKNINFIALKVSEIIFNNKKKEIKDEIDIQLETFMESIIE